MAAIDRIYVNKFEHYLLFKEWCEKQPKLKDKYGTECSISNYLFYYNSSKWENTSYPIMDAPYYVDAYIIRNCPFDFIQDELKLNYGYKTQKWINKAYNVVMNRNDENKNFYTWLTPDDFKIVDGVVTMPKPISDYKLIKEGKLYTTPYTQKKYTIGKHIKCIKHPSVQYNRPFKWRFWWVQVDPPDELGYMWYHEDHNSWDFNDEFVISESSSSVCHKYKTIRAIKRAIRKWKLPIGTTIECTGRYIYETYIFQVTK